VILYAKITAVSVIMTAIKSNTVLLRNLIDFGSVFSEIKALKSFSYLMSSFTEAPDTFEDRSLLLTSSPY